MRKKILNSPQVNTYETDKSTIYNETNGISKNVSGSSTFGGSNGLNGTENNIINNSFILTENNFYLLQENGFRINLT